MQRALVAGANPAEAAQHAINMFATYPSTNGHEVAECTFGDISVNSTQSDPIDESTIRGVIADAASEDGVIGMWRRMGEPVLAGAHGPAAARVFAEAATDVLSRLLVDAPIGRGGRTVVAPVPRRGEGGVRSLESRVLAAALAAAGVNTRLVTPLDMATLLAAVDSERPDVVVLWIDADRWPDDADVAAELGRLARSLRRRRSGLAVVAGGPRVHLLEPPGTLRTFAALDEAVGVIRSIAHR